MKKVFRTLIVNFFVLWLASQILPQAFVFDEGFKTIFWAAAGLTLMHFVIKPLIKLLLLPITILTLGLFRWVINVLGLYLTTLLVPGFTLQAFDFPGFSWQGFVVPPFEASLIYAYIITSFIISLIASFIHWLIKK